MKKHFLLQTVQERFFRALFKGRLPLVSKDLLQQGKTSLSEQVLREPLNNANIIDGRYLRGHAA